MKKCFKCGAEKGLSDFYKHPKMKDGRVGKCKECNKADVIANRLDKVDYYREYDKRRSHDPKRILARGGRLDGRLHSHVPKDHPAYAKIGSSDSRINRIREPKKHKARAKVSYAIRTKQLFRGSCEVCKTEKNIHAHHDDYAKPLNVRWLCAEHHKKWHTENGDGLNVK